MIVVTTNEIPGYRVEAVLGEVMGLTVRSANMGANFTASFRAMGGGEITEYTQLVYQSRQEVMHRMVEEGRRRGANAIVAMRFDNGSIGQAFTEVCAYGTAVVVEPIPAGEEGSTDQSAHFARAEAAAQPYAQPRGGATPPDPPAAMVPGPQTPPAY
ncbi:MULTISPECIES: YbjQ family protein [unclassified Actinotalea]|uniref:YbjQ family protein n=1 Tax=unclassified Actinotalea TaxID=2638618 RepID=UPI0015F5AB89|nr:MULTISPECIES: YbjQ family protein [unclassified Actinotalea]